MIPAWFLSEENDLDLYVGEHIRIPKGDWLEAKWTHGPWHVYGKFVRITDDLQNAIIHTADAKLDGGFRANGIVKILSLDLVHFLSPKLVLEWFGSPGDGADYCKLCGRPLKLVR